MLAAALGVSGCLLFSDPVNKAPTVSIVPPATIYRSQEADFQAVVSDDKDSPSTLQLKWKEYDNVTGSTCPSSPNDFWGGLPGNPQSFTLAGRDAKCICAQVTDSKGASGYSCYGPFHAASPPLVATITDESSANSAQKRALCTPISLSGKNSTFPAEDKDSIKYDWSIQFADVNGASGTVQLVPCAGDLNNTSRRCFTPTAPGTYTVSLTVKDEADPTLAPDVSDAFVIPVDTDHPPCLKVSDPAVHAGVTMLSRTTGEQRSFKVLKVDDDCEPYPKVTGSIDATTFHWSVFDPTSSANPQWVAQVNGSDTFTISASTFPNARAGDFIQIRLEVRDRLVQSLYQSGVISAAQPICPDTTDVCCGAGGCTQADACVRWTTWTVRFQP